MKPTASSYLGLGNRGTHWGSFVSVRWRSRAPRGPSLPRRTSSLHALPPRTSSCCQSLLPPLSNREACGSSLAPLLMAARESERRRAPQDADAATTTNYCTVPTAAGRCCASTTMCCAFPNLLWCRCGGLRNGVRVVFWPFEGSYLIGCRKGQLILVRIWLILIPAGYGVVPLDWVLNKN
jgi:hypothetical protein